jgi:SHAQKYF class myb-like DNA-binding protein
LSLHIAATQFCFVLYFSVVAEAVPKRILELMNVEKLTREHVASRAIYRYGILLACTPSINCFTALLPRLSIF